MELCREILAQYLSEENAQVVFPDLRLNAREIVEMRCYQTLKEIRAIIADDSLEDDACFQKIEAILCAFEEIGSSGGGRHDFG